MQCPNPNPGTCRFHLGADCLQMGGPPFKCQREAQTTPPATQEPSEPEVVPQATPREPEPTCEEATDETRVALVLLRRRLALAFETKHGLDARCVPETRYLETIISELEAGTLVVTRVQTERSQ